MFQGVTFKVVAWCCHTRRLMSLLQLNYVLLGVFVLLFIYTLTQDASYPYQHAMQSDINEEISQLRQSHQNDIGKGNVTYCQLYDVSKDYQADFKCVETYTSPPTTVCLYSELQDMFISHDIEYTGVWEPHVLRDFQEVLVRNPDISVLDLGANIGFYTLIAAQMGHDVVAVEPFTESIYRIHMAVQITGLAPHVKVVHNALSDKRDSATIIQSGDNQGDTRIAMEYQRCLGSCPTKVQTILLDDLIEVANFTRTVIKMDIQGYEHKAFLHAEQLLEAFDVQYIFVEWIVLRSFYVSANHTSEDKDLVNQMVTMLFAKRFRPYRLTVDNGGPLSPWQWQDWPNDIVWRRLPDDNQQKHILSNHFKLWPP